MNDPAADLHRKIEKSGRDVKGIAREAKVPYHKLVRWFSGRTVILDVRMWAKVDAVMRKGGA